MCVHVLEVQAKKRLANEIGGLQMSNGARTILLLPRILPWWPRFQPDSSAANLVLWVYLISGRQSLCFFLLSRPAPSSLWRLASSVSIPSLSA